MTTTHQTPHPVQQVTFVTAYYTIYDQPFLHRTKNWRFDRFSEICQTGIPICIFCEYESLNEVQQIADYYSNVFIMDFPEGLQGTNIAQMSKSSSYRIPSSSREGKDTVDYFILMNAKAEFVARVIQVNPFHTSKFAWMDFNLSHVFNHVTATCEYMKALSYLSYQDPFMTFSGCWPKITADDESTVIDNVNWRFCGGFFMGDADSLTNFYHLYLKWYPLFLERFNAVTWEVNFWAWLEKFGKWNPTWFAADHNDSIVKIPADFWVSGPIKVHAKQEFCDGFLEIPGYYPGSIAYLRHGGRHIINIRYLNYHILENGTYFFKGFGTTIRTKNVFAEMEWGVSETGAYTIKQIHCMTEDEIGLESRDCNWMGLEDIRLFHGGVGDAEIRFSANSTNYSNNGRNKMIEGVYDICNYKVKQARVIDSPTDTWIEKNWVPLGNQTYIYSWNPFQIGRVNENNRLEIVKQVSMGMIGQQPLFDKFRGSSIFVEDPTGHLIGVVHLSEEGSPRRYYHALVVLDKTTLEPVRISELFYFEERGIEFCIGFAVVGDEYHFWISRMDRDPALLRVKMGDLRWLVGEIK